MNDINHKKPKGAGRNSFELIDPKKLLKIIPLKAGSVVLDLACGTFLPPSDGVHVKKFF